MSYMKVLGGSTTGDAAGTFTLSTASGSVSQYFVESNVGLISNTLDSNLNGTKSSINATEGSYYASSGVGKVTTQLLSTIRLTRTITHLSKTLVSIRSTTKHTRSLLLVKEVWGIMQKM